MKIGRIAWFLFTAIPHEIASLVGVRTVYHIAWSGHTDDEHQTVGDAVFAVRPWLTPEGFANLRDDIAKRSGVTEDRLQITSLTRI